MTRERYTRDILRPVHAPGGRHVWQVGACTLHQLGFQLTDQNDLSFVLEIDGEPLAGLVGSAHQAIPHAIVYDDLPRDPSTGEHHHPDLRIVGACSCGEYACGYVRCRVSRSRGVVVLSDFDCVGGGGATPAVFRIPTEEYERVVAEIVRLSRAQRIRKRLR